MTQTILLQSTRTFTRLSAYLMFAVMLTLAAQRTHAQVVVDFESLPVPASGFFNGDINAGSPYRDNFTITGTGDNFGEVETQQVWSSDGVAFSNNYTESFGSWTGFSWSSIENNTTPGFGNQYASFANGASDGMGGTTSGTYAVGFGNAFFNLPTDASIESIDLTNTTYAALIMQDGDSGGFSKQFGGESGNDPDWFSVTLTGFDDIDGSQGTGSVIGSIEHVLADFRFSDNSLDYIQENWETLDLTSLADARSIELSFFSTDSGSFGINTPTYVAIDNLRYQITSVPEPNTSLVLWGCWFSALLRRKQTKP